MECYSCKSNSGERRISPGPTIYEGEYWYVEHAYPVRMKGWLVLVLKRHAEALHELSAEEFVELGVLQGAVTKLLHAEIGTQKEYTMCFAEADHFNHVHLHVVAKAHDLPHELRGPRIFAMLKTDEGDPLPPEEIAEFCNHLKSKLKIDTGR
ncbi:MAG: hypothetical protein ABIO92_10925 [Chloroflexia bacterium]